jgi:hypothetical protein
VYRGTLTAGIGVQVLRERLSIFDFSEWPPGEAPDFSGPDIPAFNTLVETTWKRVATLNTHLACLYTALRRVQHSGTEDGVLKKMTLSSHELIGKYPEGQGLSARCSH